jgi:plasmid stabilization system protein ParE
MSGYDFHPEAARDLDEIWDFIADDNLDAVMHGRRSPRVMAAILRSRELD